MTFDPHHIEDQIKPSESTVIPSVIPSPSYLTKTLLLDIALVVEL